METTDKNSAAMSTHHEQAKKLRKLRTPPACGKPDWYSYFSLGDYSGYFLVSGL